MISKSTVILLSALILFSSVIAACSSVGSPPSSSEPVQPLQTAAPTQPSNLTADMSNIFVDLEECAQNLGRNTGRDHKAKMIVLQLTRDQYVEFMRKDMYVYRSGGYPSAADLVSLKCSIKLLDYLNQMSPEKKQWLADLYMAAYKSGYEEK